MANDPLIQIIEEHLADDSQPEQSAEDLLYNAVAEYIFQLMNQGNIPHFLLDSLEVDLREEALIIYRKKTYGSASLQEFRSRKAKRKNSNSGNIRSGRA